MFVEISIEHHVYDILMQVNLMEGPSPGEDKTLPGLAHICTHICTYMHIDARTCTYTHMHMHTCTYMDINAHTCNVYAHMHRLAHIYTYMHMHIYMHTCMHRLAHIFVSTVRSCRRTISCCVCNSSPQPAPQRLSRTLCSCAP